METVKPLRQAAFSCPLFGVLLPATAELLSFGRPHALERRRSTYDPTRHCGRYEGRIDAGATVRGDAWDTDENKYIM